MRRFACSRQFENFDLAIIVALHHSALELELELHPQSHPCIPRLIPRLHTLPIPRHTRSKRGGDLFGDKTTFGKFTTSLVRGLKGVSNVYTQHKPLLSGVLQQVSDSDLGSVLNHRRLHLPISPSI